jgi:antimicrobial peptide system SdpB family protein
MRSRLIDVINYLLSKNPWNSSIGLGRSLLACSTLLTLLFNDSTILFKLGVGVYEAPMCIGFSKISLFCLLNNHLEFARYISIFILLAVITGFLPKVSCLFHWWVSFSVQSSCINVDGGDQINSILTLLLLPICLTDSRLNHWRDNLEQFEPNRVRKLFATTAHYVIQLQIAVLYFNAGVAKLFVTEWIDGTALFYWINDSMVGGNSIILATSKFVFDSPLLMFLITWSVLILEILLFVAFFQNQKYKTIIFYFAFAFHFGTAILFGIFSFFIAMVGVLIIYLNPQYKSVTIPSSNKSSTPTAAKPNAQS